MNSHILLCLLSFLALTNFIKAKDSNLELKYSIYNLAENNQDRHFKEIDSEGMNNS